VGGKRLTHLAQSVGDPIDLGAKTASNLGKSCNSAPECDRNVERMIPELLDQDKQSARQGLGQGLLDLKLQLSLARLPRRSDFGKRLIEIVRSSSKQDKEKAPMAAIAVDALAAYDSAREGIADAKLKGAFEAAVVFGRCIGRLEERIGGAAPRRGKGAVRAQLLRAYQEWQRDPSKKKGPKFDLQTAMRYSKELTLRGPRSLANMISELKAEEKKHAAWLQSVRSRPKHLLLATVEDFDGKFLSGEGFP
jgi:hypothetical protein